MELPFRIKSPVLGLGAQAKNTICFAKGKSARISRIHSDLSVPSDLLVFEKDTKGFLKLKPKIIAYDLHPDYQSTKFVNGLSASSYQLSGIQHHHAHIASCMVENELKNQKVVGVAFDGTGLGADNGLWGAEFLICDYKGFKRVAHLRESALIGGEAAIKEPWRVAAFWLHLIYKDKFLSLDADFTQRLDGKKWLILKKMHSKAINSPMASSMGRLFDAAAALILAKTRASFEAELPIELEKIASADSYRQSAFGFGVKDKNGILIIDPSQMFKEIVSELKKKQAVAAVAYRFHLTVAEMIRKTCLILRKKHKINKVALSGGTFQNKLLLNMALDLLKREGFEIFTHKKLSCNDSAVSLGQAAIAGYRS